MIITSSQQKWLAHLSDTTKVKIVSFDPTSVEKFEKVKTLIQSKLGANTPIVHCGASSLGISGQDEIDVYIPVPEKEFNNYICPLTELFGNPRSHYELERARFVTEVDGKHIDIFLINENHRGWLDSVKFEKYLRANMSALKEYETLKESSNGLNVREYYRQKIAFINEILAKA